MCAALLCDAGDICHILLDLEVVIGPLGVDPLSTRAWSPEACCRALRAMRMWPSSERASSTWSAKITLSTTNDVDVSWISIVADLLRHQRTGVRLSETASGSTATDLSIFTCDLCVRKGVITALQRQVWRCAP